MKHATFSRFAGFLWIGALALAAGSASAQLDLQPVIEVKLEAPIMQLRAAPVQLGPGEPRAFFVIYGPDFDLDPYHKMFFYPTGTLKLAVIDATGKVRWRNDLGRGIPPGLWFCPAFPCDMNGDGVDEIYFVFNRDRIHPLDYSQYKLERVDARTGRPTGSLPFPEPAGEQTVSHTYRNFIFGGRVKGQPVLVTAQGTYGAMSLQAWNPDMTRRWEHKIPGGRYEELVGARGSHMTPVVDFDGDGIEEVLWGERLIELDRGREIFCADRDVYKGHTDIVQPFLDPRSKRWHFFTCRESDGKATPRILTFNDRGERVWSDVAQGHIDQGWTARSGLGEFVAWGLKIEGKTLDPSGRFRTGLEEFTYDARTGTKKPLPFKCYLTIPVDFDGDAVHELIYGAPGGSGKVIDWSGKDLADTKGGFVAMASKFLDLPGEQVLSYYEDGTIKVWAARNVKDTPAATARYAHPFYKANQAQTANGYNYTNLGGL